MSNRVINLILVALLATAGVLAWTIRKDPTRPNIELFPAMTHSVPYDSFAPAEVFADGMAMREPPAHAIPRGFEPFLYEATEADAVRAGEELLNPYSEQNVEQVKRGERVFASFCLPCHGARGAGDGAVVMRGFPAPPSLHSPDSRALADGRIFHIITRGQGNMPAHGAQIPEEDRWRAVLFIRSLQRSPTETDEPPPTPVP